MEGRTQAVDLDGHLSCYRKLSCGCPQGSVLSPLLFLIYMADLPLWLNANDREGLISFADDLYVLVKAQNSVELREKLENVAQDVLEFMAVNVLKANVAKTKLMALGAKPTLERSPTKILVDGHIVLGKPGCKALGVHIQSDLKWNTHIRWLVGKRKSGLGMIRMLLSRISRKCLKVAIESLILSQIRYCLPLFFSPQAHNRDRDHGPGLQKELQKLGTKFSVNI